MLWGVRLRVQTLGVMHPSRGGAQSRSRAACVRAVRARVRGRGCRGVWVVVGGVGVLFGQAPQGATSGARRSVGGADVLCVRGWGHVPEPVGRAPGPGSGGGRCGARWAGGRRAVRAAMPAKYRYPSGNRYLTFLFYFVYIFLKYHLRALRPCGLGLFYLFS